MMHLVLDQDGRQVAGLDVANRFEVESPGRLPVDGIGLGREVLSDEVGRPGSKHDDLVLESREGLPDAALRGAYRGVPVSCRSRFQDDATWARPVRRSRGKGRREPVSAATPPGPSPRLPGVLRIDDLEELGVIQARGIVVVAMRGPCFLWRDNVRIAARQNAMIVPLLPVFQAGSGERPRPRIVFRARRGRRCGLAGRRG